MAPEEAQVLPVVGFVPVGKRLLHNGVRLLPVPGIPLVLNIVRSPAESTIFVGVDSALRVFPVCYSAV